MNGASAPNPFTLGNQIFGGAISAEDDGDDGTDRNGEEEEEEGDDASSEHSLVTAIATVSLDDSPWKAAPSFPALYLNTVSEYLPPAPKVKVAAGVGMQDEEEDKSMTWTMEAYENSLEVDHVFERFTQRVGYEPQQCVR
jgi:pre-rRNA-processing protein TSR4